MPELFCLKNPPQVDVTTYQVTKSQNSFTVGDDDRPHVVLRPVAQDVVHVALVVDGDEQTLKKKTHCHVYSYITSEVLAIIVFYMTNMTTE